MRKLLALALTGLSLLLPSFSSSAQIKLGISGPLEGKNAGSMLELVKGAELYFDHINQAGGVNGQKIVVVARNDNFEVEKTVVAVKQLIEQDQVTALLLVRGTPHNVAILPLVAQHKIPLIGPSTGAMVFHKPVNPYVFNIRTTYQREAEKLVALLKTTGQTKIAVLHVNDGFGQDVMVGLKSGFIDANLQPLVVLPFDREAAAKDSVDFMKPIQAQVTASDPQVVIVVGAGLAVKNAVVALRAVGSTAKIATMSNNASNAFIKLMEPNERGIIVSQVFPDEKSFTHPFVREAQMMAYKKKITLTPGMMEGFAAAKVVVKGLQGAGSPPTRASLHKSLESMRSFDLGGLLISFTPTDHTGLDITDLSIITKEKAFLR